MSNQASTSVESELVVHSSVEADSLVGRTASSAVRNSAW